MIREVDITIVIQGDVRSNTRRVIDSIRRQVPAATLIFSTFPDQLQAVQDEGIGRLVDHLCVGDDPGALPSTVKSPTAQPNNINRMLRSTQRGLAKVTTPYVLKLRSDAECFVYPIVHGWEVATKELDSTPSRRLTFASHFTRHPHGMNGYTFHVSDWMTFGRTEVVIAYWSAHLFTVEEALWFENQPLPHGLTATTRRFRSLFTQEQWLCVEYARRIGYATPAHAHDRRPEVVQAYQRFLAKECVVLDVQDIGLHVPKQAWAKRSLFQELDCVSHEDWLEIAGHRPPNEKRSKQRAIARKARGLIAHGVLIKKWFQARWRVTTPPQSKSTDPKAASPPATHPQQPQAIPYPKSNEPS